MRVVEKLGERDGGCIDSQGTPFRLILCEDERKNAMESADIEQTSAGPRFSTKTVHLDDHLGRSETEVFERRTAFGMNTKFQIGAQPNDVLAEPRVGLSKVSLECRDNGSGCSVRAGNRARRAYFATSQRTGGVIVRRAAFIAAAPSTSSGEASDTDTYCPIVRPV